MVNNDYIIKTCLIMITLLKQILKILNIHSIKITYLSPSGREQMHPYTGMILEGMTQNFTHGILLMLIASRAVSKA